MTVAAELCGACGATLRSQARFCGRCGGEQGRLVPRDGGLGRELIEPAPRRRPAIGPGGIALALGLYGAMLVPQLILLRSGAITLRTTTALEAVFLGLGLVVLFGLGRDGRAWLGRPRWPLALAGRHLALTLGLAGTVAAIAALAPTLFADQLGFFGSLPVALLLGAVTPAIAEEIVFRGAILASLEGVFEERSAAIVCALMFAALHLSPMSIPHLALLGFLLARVRGATGSIWPCVLLHATYNATVLVLDAIVA